MGFNDFWNDRADAANEFLRTGRSRDDSLLARDNTFTAKNNTLEARDFAEATRDNTLNTGADCVSTSSCPSGWGCVNGVCVQLNNGSSGGSNTPGGGGNCDPSEPESPCNSGGPNSCQEKPQCGDTDDEARECCGTRCCSFGSASSSRPGVHCFCGECPPWPGCTSFCDSYLKSNGEVGPGCKEGRDGNSCDGCTECDGNVGGECKPIFIGADCWCAGEECNGANCEKCDTDENSPNFGECALDATNCQQCATITNHVCPCGFAYLGQPVLPPITVCKSYGEGGLLPINLAQQEAARQCDEICNGDGKEDPCKPKTTNATYCTDTGTGTASCPEGSKQTGFLEAGGETCVFCATEDYSDAPDSCKACDCNCHNDCPECQLCGADGTCYPDPTCQADSYTVEAIFNGVHTYFGYAFVGFPVGSIFNCEENVSENEVLFRATGVPLENVGLYEVRSTTGASPHAGVEFCTTCNQVDDKNDTCEGTTACPSTYTVQQVYLNGNPIASTSRFISGCDKFTPQGGSTTWFYKSGQISLRIIPEFN